MDADLLKEIHDKFILHWNYRDFCELPEELREEGQHVSEIYLKCNNIEKLPVWLGHLKNLTNLYLHGNRLQSLPDEIDELESLFCLDVGQNYLTSLPSTIGKLSRLNILCATKNFLTNLPEEIFYLTSLKVLLLSTNMLSYLPESICKCRDLEEICLDENCLTNLPQRIVYLPKLAFLSVTSNKILYLPALPFISSPRLCIENNPFLNYVSYCVGSQVSLLAGQDGNSWNIETFGCFESNALHKDVLGHSVLHIKRPFYLGRNCIELVMPQGLLTVCCSLPEYKKVPSMFELSIRLVYQILNNHKLNFECTNSHHIISMFYKEGNHNVTNIFPTNINKQLHKGPITICNNPNCNNPIFTYAFIWIIPKITVNRAGDRKEILSTIYFCSDHCSSQCRAYGELVPSKLDWQEMLLE